MKLETKIMMIVLIIFIIGIISYHPQKTTPEKKPIVSVTSTRHPVTKNNVNGQRNGIVEGISIPDLDVNLSKILPTSNFKVTILPQEVLNFMTKDQYSKEFLYSDKKFIIPPSSFEILSCPGGKTFITSLKAAQNSDAYKKNYSTYALSSRLHREVDLFGNFKNNCCYFAIVNPKTKHVILFSGASEKLANAFQPVLNYLKDKNF